MGSGSIVNPGKRPAQTFIFTSEPTGTVFHSDHDTIHCLSLIRFSDIWSGREKEGQ